mgnify:CR=1 FL=1
MTQKLEEILNLPNVKEAFKQVDKKEQARERLRLPQAPQPNQIEENQEEDEEEEEEEEEEHVLASSKLMLKIAQKLDLKKKYRLADKLTYILGKSNV